jgi:hypothetical protein
MSATQQVLDGLMAVLTPAAGTASLSVVRAGGHAPDPRPDVLVTPVGLTRVGRSRRAGALLDVELSVAVEAGGSDVLDLTERLLLAAEAAPHTRIDPLPPERPGFGFVVVLAASLTVPEPTGPPVREVVVEVEPLVAVTGTVVDPDGAAVPGVAVRSSLLGRQAVTDAAGRFTLAGLSRPTTLTLARGARRTTFDLPADPTGIRVVLPNHEGG